METWTWQAWYESLAPPQLAPCQLARQGDVADVAHAGWCVQNEGGLLVVTSGDVRLGECLQSVSVSVSVSVPESEAGRVAIQAK